MSYWDYLPYCIAVAAVLYYLWTQKDNTAIVMDPPNLEFGYPQPAHVLRYEGEELITESTRKELVHYFAKTAYEWHASKWKCPSPPANRGVLHQITGKRFGP